jgi:co-chaperonin GroES (HSP10)
MRAVKNKLILKPKKAKETSPRGFLQLPASAQLSNEWEQEFEVMAVGPLAETEIEAGDRVLIRVYEGLEGKRTFKHEGQRYTVVEPEVICARIRAGSSREYTVDGRGTW